MWIILHKKIFFTLRWYDTVYKTAIYIFKFRFNKTEDLFPPTLQFFPIQYISSSSAPSYML